MVAAGLWKARPRKLGEKRSSWFIAIRSTFPVFSCQEELSTLPN
jgi:hypothetical protein